MARLTNYPLQFAACRDLGHAWFYTAWIEGAREVRCSNCHTYRVDRFDQGGRLVARKYIYPLNYLSKSRLDVDVAIEIRARLKDAAKKLGIRWWSSGGGRHEAILRHQLRRGRFGDQRPKGRKSRMGKH